jgi:hypothetical protein
LAQDTRAGRALVHLPIAERALDELVGGVKESAPPHVEGAC